MSTLIICLPPLAAASGPAGGPAASYDYALTSDERSVTDHASVPLALLPAVQRGIEVVALVPASELSWHAVELPKGINATSPRLRAILENLLEDRLLDEPSQLHLALAPVVLATGVTWVAVCNKAWLREHVQALESSGRPVSRIVPEFAPETGPLQVYATGEPDRAWLLATGQAIDGVLRLPLGAVALSLLPASDGPLPLAAEPAVAALAEQLMDGRPGKTSLLTRQERWLDAARAPWDLAQFDFSSSGRARTLKRLSGLWRDLAHAPGLRPARWGLVVLLLANLVGLNAWAWKERSALQLRQNAIRDTLTQTFPQVRLVVDAPLQMERELAALRQATGASSGRDLEAMLALLGSLLPPERSVTGIDFSNGELKARGLQLGTQESADMSGPLAARGYSLQVEGDAAVISQDNKKEGAP